MRAPGTSRSRGHVLARATCPPGPCELCGNDSKPTEVHHVDRNPLNNDPGNLRRLCISCHRRTHNPRATCTICGRPANARGWCITHYHRWMRQGDPHLVEVVRGVPGSRPGHVEIHQEWRP